MEPRFGYTCQECGKGKVVRRVFDLYKTKIQGLDFTVPNAVVGVCDVCGAEHFSGPETERWYELFDQSRKHLYLPPEEIRQIRESLGLNMEQFAQLIGTSRQSLHNWERSERTFNQSRVADLLLRMVRTAQVSGKVDVLGFLVGQAKAFGYDLRMEMSSAKSIALSVQRSPLGIQEEAEGYDCHVAAWGQQSSSRSLLDDRGQAIGKVWYDHLRHCLAMQASDIKDGKYNFVLLLDNGEAENLESVAVQKGKACLAVKTDGVLERVRLLELHLKKAKGRSQGKQATTR